MSELYALTPELFDASANEIHVPGTKTRKARRRIPLARAAREVIERRAAQTAPGQPLFPRWWTIQRDLDAACLRLEKRLNPGWERPEGRKGHGSGELAGRAPKRNAKGAPPPKRGRIAPPNPFPSVSPNDLRRTFASWLASQGVPILQARDLMGHESTSMLEQVYARLSPQSLHDAIRAIAASPTAGSSTWPSTESFDRTSKPGTENPES